MNKMVIFDLDGTLLDTLDDLCNSVNYSLRTNNFPERSLAEVRTFVGNGIRLLIERSVPEGTSKELIDKTFEYFKKQGVAIKVISGDNPLTASKVAIRAGIDDATHYIDATTLKTDKAV